MERGMTSNGSITESIMVRVDGMMDEIKNQITGLTEEDQKIKRSINEVFDALKKDMMNLAEEQSKTDQESRKESRIKNLNLNLNLNIMKLIY